MTSPETTRPVVLIVGAGIAGLTLGALLEKAGVPYAIFERAATINPIGSAIVLSSAVMPMLKQLGMYDQLVALGKPVHVNNMHNAQGKLVMVQDYSRSMEERFDSSWLLLARPILYQSMLDQIPKEKVHYRKKLLSYKHTDDGIKLNFSDNSTFEGTILVGADGANSAVRQNLYKELDQANSLPASDKLPLKYSSISLVGQTKVLDPEKYPILKTEGLTSEFVLGDNLPLIACAFPTAQNTLCWMVVEFLDKESFKLHDSFRNSEWGPEAAEEMARREDVRAPKFPSLNNGTMGDIIDLTPKEIMSKVMLEEKVFKTWAHERVVLVGDACHKMTPAAGQGAVNAMNDALVLANYLETLRGNNLEEIKTICKEYKKERYRRAKGAVDASAISALGNQNGWASDIFRVIISNAPGWLWNSIVSKAGEYRPQAAFLPPVDDKGTVKPLYQPSLHLEKSTRCGAAV